MKPYQSFLLLILGLLFASIGLSQREAIAETTFSGKVVSITDGDTLDVMHNGRAERVRLHGIDAPEGHQDFGSKAKTVTSGLAFGKIVEVTVTSKDRYGRSVGVVRLPDGRVLNHEIVAAGFAWWYERYAPDDPVLSSLETKARAKKLGLWASPNAIPPWEFRHGPTTETSASANNEKFNEAIVGNRNSRVYHRRSCPGYSMVAPQNRIPFSSASEAEQSGFRLAGNCR